MLTISGGKENKPSRMSLYQINTWFTLIEKDHLGDWSPGKDSGADPGEVKWVNFHPPFF